MKEKQIEQNIREQMIALSAQMDALNEWKATGYNSEICTPALHDWRFEYSNWEEYDGDNKKPINLWWECRACGIQTTRYYNFSDEVITDNWTPFREGGEEE